MAEGSRTQALDAQTFTLGLPSGGRATFYEPVGPACCDACGRHADDVCVELIEPGSAAIHHGMCSSCLIQAIRRQFGHVAGVAEAAPPE